ncbi:Small subunit (SSU) processome component [Thelotrema lepadinum]|nr:Small subunit (SSU) processome component [Thelotrema lepadinum]
MVRKLKHHEQKLLRKVDLVEFKKNEHRANDVIRRYAIQKPSDYSKYNKVAGKCRLAELEPDDPFRRKHEALLLEKLYAIGILGTEGAGGRGKLSEIENKVTVSSLCRRRLGVVMTRLKMADTVQAAIKFIEQGHVRVGPEVVTDPAMLISRNMEDFVTWIDSSKIKRNILKYRDKLDDFDLL